MDIQGENQSDESKADDRGIWYKHYVNEYKTPNAQLFLDWCENQKIIDIAMKGFIETVKEEMMNHFPNGRMTAREIRGLALSSVFGETMTNDGWNEWLEMAVHFKIFQVEKEVIKTQTGEEETIVFYTHFAVKEAVESVTKSRPNKSKAGKISAEKRKLDAEKAAKKEAQDKERKRIWYEKNKDRLKAKREAKKTNQQPVEHIVEQIKNKE